MVKKALAVTALLLLTGCGISEVDIDVVEEDITSGVKEQLDQDVTVDCPDQVDWKTGESFTCDVEDADGNVREANVEMLNDDGDVEWELG